MIQKNYTFWFLILVYVEMGSTKKVPHVLR